MDKARLRRALVRPEMLLVLVLAVIIIAIFAYVRDPVGVLLVLMVVAFIGNAFYEEEAD